MLENIVDHRTNSYDVKVDCILEPSWHNNKKKDATKFELPYDDKPEFEFSYVELPDKTVEEVIQFCQNYHFSITAYFYDVDSKPWKIEKS